MSLNLVFLLLGAALVAGATVSFRHSKAVVIRSASATWSYTPTTTAQGTNNSKHRPC